MSDQKPSTMSNENDEELFLLRRPSRLSYLSTNNQKLDVRAHQRTYQGAYMRSCLGCLSFSVVVLKLFSKSFLSIGLVYVIFGMFICTASYIRSKNIDLYFLNPEKRANWLKVHNGEDEFMDDDRLFFKTSGDIVLWLSIISLGCYITLLVLLSRV